MTPADDLFATLPITQPNNAIGFLLWKLQHRYQRTLDRVLERFDLTHLQFMTLVLSAWLGRTGEPVTQSALGRFAQIEPMQLSQVLKTLKRKGFIDRIADAGDGRAKCVELTDAGRDALRRALPVAIHVQHRMFGEDGSPGGTLHAALLHLEQSWADAIPGQSC